MFIETIQMIYRIIYDDWSSERRLVTDSIHQIDIGSTQSVKSRKNLFCSHQTAIRLNAPNENEFISFIDHLDVRKYLLETDGYRYPADCVLTYYDSIDYVDQFRDLNLFYKEHVGEELLNPFISYPDMKTEHPVRVIELIFQIYHITLKKIQLFEDFIGDPDNARLFVLLIRQRETQMISDGNKLIEIKVIQNNNT